MASFEFADTTTPIVTLLYQIQLRSKPAEGLEFWLPSAANCS
jgi:hypothetical protein